MIFRRGIPLFPVVLVAAAVAILVAAALTSWWMLLALIPLVMMLGCMAMMIRPIYASLGARALRDPAAAG